ncbi:hypothetical protein HPULCUR_003487 [Helicostylum pulchrum]|uniref:FAR1 domain-containing protein n=1 Tax=Helicostylum pulchrum TaxID=562976 RepID=A0ABP9XTJ4_9FUNG
MTKRLPPSTQVTGEQNTFIQHPTHQSLTPERQQEQAIMLEPFYERLIGTTFDHSTKAIEHCRDLCAEFGFTVKQEASTHRNIYVYCSREGLPDSLRNPKANPQRKRPSKRCDCKWRVVLYENENHWEFRKSLNPDAGKHNHELMHPEEIERSWPKEVTVLICELARLRITTQDIRNRVRGQFPNIHWNERRFYNRLSEERQKIKQRDTTERTHQLTEIWSKVCMATAGNDDLYQFVKQEMLMLFQSLCETAQIDPQSFPSPSILLKGDECNSEPTSPSSVGHDSHSTDAYDTNTDYDSKRKSSSSQKSIKQCTNKGYIPVEIPKQIYYIKVHNQRQLHEAQLLKNQRRPRTYSEDANTPNLLEPPRKLSRKGKERLSSDDSLPSDSLQPLIAQNYANNDRLNTPTPHVGIPRRQDNIQQHQQQMLPATQFVYYENRNMPLDSSLSGYVHSSFQSNYNMNSSPSTPGFNSQDLAFSFDSSMNRNSGESSEPDPNLHPVLQSNPHQKQPPKKSVNNIMPQSQQQQMYSNNNKQPQPPPPSSSQQQQQQQQQQMNLIYESPKNNNMRSIMSDPQQPYQRQQGLYMRQPTSPNQHHVTNTILPMYQQQQLPPDALRLNNMHHQNLPPPPPPPPPPQ